MQQRADGEGPAPGGDEEVAAFLRARPDFLAAHPGLYDLLEPPRRVHGTGLADHMAAMLVQARGRASDAERAGLSAAADRRAAEGFGRRVQETVVALMRAPDPGWLAAHELAGLLRLDTARVCSEATEPPEGTASVPRGTVAAALGQRAAVVRAAQADAVLHGEAVALAAQEALVRVPLQGGPALLALACRDARDLSGATTDALTFLGQAVGAALDGAPRAAPSRAKTG